MWKPSILITNHIIGEVKVCTNYTHMPGKAMRPVKKSGVVVAL